MGSWKPSKQKAAFKLQNEELLNLVYHNIFHKTLSLSDPTSLMYAIQQQALGSIQWTIIASGLKETNYTITTLSKSVRYAFRVLTITSKAFSKPSPATDPVQLLDRGSLTSLSIYHSSQPVYDVLTSWIFLSRLLPSGGSSDY